MKIDFSEKHKDKILHFIQEYKTINEEYSNYATGIVNLQHQLNELKEKLQSTENILKNIRKNEKIYMDELHSIYGDFTLNDLYESIY